MKKTNIAPNLGEIIRDSMDYMLQKSYVTEGFRGCSGLISSRPVDVEPAFVPYRLMDFGKQSSAEECLIFVCASKEQVFTFLSVWIARNNEYDSGEAFRELVSKIGALGKKFVVRLSGNRERISFCIGVVSCDVIPVKNAIKSVFPNAEIGVSKEKGFAANFEERNRSLFFREFFTPPPYWRTLAAETNTISSMLSCLSSELNSNECGFYELIIQPCRNDWANNVFNLCVAERQGGVPLHVSQGWRQAGFTQEYSEKSLQKNNKQMFAVIARAGAFCDSGKRGDVIKSLCLSLGGLLWGGQKLSYVSLDDFVKGIGKEKTEDMIRKSLVYRAGSLLSIDELSFLSPLPSMEEVRCGKFRIDSSSGLIVSQDCIKAVDGAFIGNVSVAGKKFPYYQKKEFRARGTGIRSVNGGGKSAQINQMSDYDLENRRRIYKDGSGRTMSILLMDQCEDTYSSFLRKLRKQEIEETDIFDPTIPGYVPAYNIVKLNPWENIDKKADNRAIQIKNLFSANEWSAHIEHIFRNAFYLLLADPHAVLTDIWQILEDSPKANKKRAEILNAVDNMAVHLFWERDPFKADKARFSLIQKKISSLLTDKRIQDIFSVRDNKFDMTRIMNEGRIMACNLSEGKLGTGASRFLAGCLIEDIVDATKYRVRLPSKEREKSCVSFYIDEIGKCPPKSFEDFLVSMRKYNVSPIFSYHFDEQLTEDLQAGMRNLGTTILLRQDYKQAKGQAFSQFLGRVNAEDFVDLEPGEGFIITPDSNIAKFRSVMPQEGNNEDVIKKVIERNLRENYVRTSDIQREVKVSKSNEGVSRTGGEI